jgi:sec-independent protein translocase protein TatA
MGDALAPWHIIILVIVLVLLFGARRLPGAAQSLGQSMHIFKKSVQGLNPDDQTSSTPGWAPPASYSSNTAANPPEAATALTPAPDATQQQLADLQRQVADLQRQAATVSNGQAQPEQTQTPQSL